MLNDIVYLLPVIILQILIYSFVLYKVLAKNSIDFMEKGPYSILFEEQTKHFLTDSMDQIF